MSRGKCTIIGTAKTVRNMFIIYEYYDDFSDSGEKDLDLVKKSMMNEPEHVHRLNYVNITSRTIAKSVISLLHKFGYESIKMKMSLYLFTYNAISQQLQPMSLWKNSTATHQ